MKRIIQLLIMFIILGMIITPTAAQSNLVAVLEVLNPGVEVQPAETDVWVAINTETLINVGDRIRTDETGEARITFFADETTTEMTPDSEIRIQKFEGSGREFNISLEIVSGIVGQQVNTLIDPGSSYEVITPGMAMTVRGTGFDVRVEDNGRSALITSEGEVAAQDGGAEAAVPTGFGIRSEVDAPLSDVVAATSFDELDAALDGCTGIFETDGDVRMYVRLSPAQAAQQVGSIDPSEVNNLLGISADQQWYRIPFRGGFGWISASLMTVTVNERCPGLRQYDETPVEDASLFTTLDLSGDDALVIVEGSSLRERPGTTFDLIKPLTLGEVVQIIGKDPTDEWLQVRTSDGTVGWISITLVQLYSDLDEVEIIAPEATPAATEESGG